MGDASLDGCDSVAIKVVFKQLTFFETYQDTG
jgi:hypothetical protein